jgi:hypothetical protein
MPRTNRRSFLARGAALAAVPTVATLVGATTLPDYAPIPPSALGPAVNEQGYYVGRVDKSLYWVTDGIYQAAFLTTRDDVVVHQRYVTDVADNVRTAMARVDPTSYFTKYGNNSWAAVKTYLDVGYGSQVHP